MSGRVVFLLEEPSMKDLLDGLLPRLFPKLPFLCIPHEGKSDLDKSIPRKLASWKIPHDRFVIVRDNDAANCVATKKRLLAMCQQAKRPDTLVRLVCQELESWYLGDLAALAKAYSNQKIDSPAARKRFAIPDDWQKPSRALEDMLPQFQKRQGARLMGERLGWENRSHSYAVFVQGVARLAQELGCD